MPLSPFCCSLQHGPRHSAVVLLHRHPQILDVSVSVRTNRQEVKEEEDDLGSLRLLGNNSGPSGINDQSLPDPPLERRKRFSEPISDSDSSLWPSLSQQTCHSCHGLSGGESFAVVPMWHGVIAHSRTGHALCRVRSAYDVDPRL